MKPCLLILCPSPPSTLARLAEHFDCHYAPDAESRRTTIAEHAASIQMVLTTGAVGLAGAEIVRLPALQLVSALGVGYENIDLGAARERGIALCSGAGSNAASVADHAMALLLAAIRDLRNLDIACRAGLWRTQLPAQDGVGGKRVGILGLGAIGERIATRAMAFEMSVGYHNRTPKDASPHRYFDSPLALARWADCLVVAIPGGAATHHLVGREMLEALGAGGYLVNVGRGSVVDTAALADALRRQVIRGAALDVYESEPLPPQELVALDNVILCPHLGGNSPQAVAQALTQFIENVRRHFAGEPLLTPL